VKLKMYDEAADAIRREIGMHQAIEHQPSVGRLAVVLVLVQLARGDQVAAEKAFKEWGNYCEVAEIQTLEMLLQAYDNEDANMARAALNSPFIKHMDVEYAKLARGLPLPATQEYAIPPTSASKESEASSSPATPARVLPSKSEEGAAGSSIEETDSPAEKPQEEGEEYDEGLC